MSENESIAESAEVNRQNRLVLLLIAGIPLTMILLASWLWYFVVEGDLDIVGMMGTANQGTLVEPPLPLHELGLRRGPAEIDLFSSGEPRWRILVAGIEGCDEACEHMLYYTRQIHTAMGKEQNRIERIFLVADADLEADWSQRLAAEHPRLKVLYTAGPVASGLAEVAAGAAQQPAYFLVDPRGWVMMYYTAEQDGKDIMADLKFLLKNSNG